MNNDRYKFKSPFFYQNVKVEQLILPNATLSNILDYELKIDDEEKSIVLFGEKLEHSIFLFIAYIFMLTDFSKILIIYHTKEEFELWIDLLSIVVSHNDYKIIHITDGQEIEDSETNDHATVFVFIHLDRLWDIFPQKNRIHGLVPFVTPTDEVDAALPGNFLYTSEFNRLGIAAKPLKEPIDINNPYAFEWSCVVFNMHGFDFENRMNVAYVINGVFCKRNIFFIDKFLQREDPACLHAIVSMAKPTMRMSYDYNFTDTFTMNNFIDSDYHVLEVDENVDQELMTTVVKKKPPKKRPIDRISNSSLQTSQVSQIRSLSEDSVNVERERLFLDFNALFFWHSEKGIVKKTTGKQNKTRLIVIPDTIYIDFLKKLDKKKCKREWKDGYATSYLSLITREWFVKRRLEALVRFFNNYYTEQFYLLVESNTFPNIKNITKNVSVIFAEERAHLILPVNANLVVFTPYLALKSATKMKSVACNILVPVMDYWLEFQIAYNFLHKFCLPAHTIKRKLVRLPSSIFRKNQSFKAPTRFEEAMIPVFYYDSDSNRYDSLYDYMSMIRSRVFCEINHSLSNLKKTEEIASTAADFYTKKDMVKSAMVPWVDQQVVFYKRRIYKNEQEKRPRQAAEYRFRLRQYLSKQPPFHQPTAIIKKIEDDYEVELVKAMEAFDLEVEEARPALLHSESVSFYSGINDGCQRILTAYNNQKPPPIPNPLDNLGSWKNQRNNTSGCKSTLSDVLNVLIPCDSCQKVFKTYEEFHLHLSKYAHALHQKIAEEEAKFMAPLPIFNNEADGYYTTCPTTLNISELWKRSTREYYCSLCSMKFKNGSFLLKHYKCQSHRSRVENKKQTIRSCTLCGFQSKKGVDKTAHENTEAHKRELKKFTCQICLTLHYGYTSYANHVNRCAKEAKKSSCSLLSFLKDDVETYDTTCFICKKQYAKYKNFETHCESESHESCLSSFLKEAKKCETCQKIFYCSEDYDLHVDSLSSCTKRPEKPLRSVEKRSLVANSTIEDDSLATSEEEEVLSSDEDNLVDFKNATTSSLSIDPSSVPSGSLGSVDQESEPVGEIAGLEKTRDVSSPSSYRIYLNKPFIFITELMKVYEKRPEKYKKGDLLTSSFIDLPGMSMEDVSSYLTLEAIDRCIPKKNSFFYKYDDNSAGILACEMNMTFGVIGYFGSDIKRLLIQLFRKHSAQRDGVILRMDFSYFPSILLPLLREVSSEFKLDVFIQNLDKRNTANDVFGLYVKVICGIL